METHAGLPSYLLIASLRSVALFLAAAGAVWICRVRQASTRHPVWTMVACGMLLQIVLPRRLPSLSIKLLRPVTAVGVAAEPVAATRWPLPVPIPSASSSRIPSWTRLLEAAYTGMAIFFLARILLGCLLARRLLRRSVLLPELGRPFLESPDISVPVTIGWLRPRVLLPVAWRDWDASKLRAVIAHEEAHIRRADWAVQILARINQSVFWFHPLGWWLERHIGRLAEQAADDAALAQTGDRERYAQVLLDMALALKTGQGRVLRESTAMVNQSSVAERIDRVLSATRIPRAFGASGWMALLACATPVLYVVSAVQLAPAQSIPLPPVPVLPLPVAAPAPEPARAQAHPVPAPAPKRVTSAYDRWLDEEVVYIITEKEREAFTRLETNQEREHFIEQFWARRDPTPGTPENEFREEHYRRIAYANQTFADKARDAGWKMDRGRMYISYGAPDEEEVHPSGSAWRDDREVQNWENTLAQLRKVYRDSYPDVQVVKKRLEEARRNRDSRTIVTEPFELWRYRYIEGVGTDVRIKFVDHGDGKYQMVP